MRNKLLGYYNYTVVLTYIGMIVGFLGLICVMEGNEQTSLICLMIAGVCDMFDGAIASTMKRTRDEKDFGIQIDSLSDLICFGVLPAVILCSLNNNDELTYAIATLYVLSALIRLAYFNVDEQKRQKVSTEIRKYYYGLPVTTIAVIMPIMFMVSQYFGNRRGSFANITLFITGILFLVPFPIKKPKIIGKITLGLCGILEFILLIGSMGDI